MSGHVYYRFKSQKEPARITFDGVGISVFDLKREIILNSKMGKGSDFDLSLFSADGQDEYANDHIVVPRSTTVIAQRRPPKKPGQGNAQTYVADVVFQSRGSAAAPAPHADWRGGGAIVKDFRQRETPKFEITPSADGAARDAEAEDMAAMFAAQEQQWQETQETMATQTRVGRGGYRGGGPNRFGGRDRPPREFFEPRSAKPPEGYICYRCGSKEHWIQECPTNNDPEFENKPRIKRTTGIPKSFLQKIEGTPQDGQNVMVMPDGTLVIAKPDDASWQHHKEATVVKNLTAADIQNLQPSDPDLACSICSKLLKEAVKTPCCGSSFCDTCIRPHLKENHNVCPECESKVAGGARGLVPDEDRRQRSQDYIDDLVRASKEAAGSGSSEDGKDEGGKEADEPAPSPKPASEPAEASVSGDTRPGSEPAGPADDDLYTLPVPAAPAMESKPSNDGSTARSVSASRPSAEPEASHASTPPQPGTNGLPPIPMPMPMMMNNNGAPHGGMMMGGGANNLAMLQQQFMHHSMMLQNPALPPPMRAQLMMARQHVNQQIIMIQQQQMAAQQQQHQAPPPQFARGGGGVGIGGRGGRGAARGGGRGGNSNRFNLSDFQARLQQQQGAQIPNPGPAYQQQRTNNVRRPPTGPKRGRGDDAIELTTGEVDEGPPGKMSRQD